MLDKILYVEIFNLIKISIQIIDIPIGWILLLINYITVDDNQFVLNTKIYYAHESWESILFKDGTLISNL